MKKSLSTHLSSLELKSQCYRVPWCIKKLGYTSKGNNQTQMGYGTIKRYLLGPLALRQSLAKQPLYLETTNTESPLMMHRDAGPFGQIATLATGRF
jgi:hypothetical protein